MLRSLADAHFASLAMNYFVKCICLQFIYNLLQGTSVSLSFCLWVGIRLTQLMQTYTSHHSFQRFFTLEFSKIWSRIEKHEAILKSKFFNHYFSDFWREIECRRWIFHFYFLLLISFHVFFVNLENKGLVSKLWYHVD